MLFHLEPVEIGDEDADCEFNEFWEWYQGVAGKGRLREVLILGYYALKSQDDAWKRRYDLVVKEYNNVIKEKNQIREQVKYEMEASIREKVDREVARIDAMSMVRNKEIEVEMLAYKGLYEAAKKEMSELVGGALMRGREKEIADLTAALKRAEDELGILRRSNYGKGVVGEAIVRDVLKREYPAACIVDTAQVKHSCDLHMVLDDREVYAFESKYKDTIVKTDIDKFYNDVIHMSVDPRFHGAVFVSLKTANIPGKGDLCLEMVGGKIPVLFVGGTEDWLSGSQWFKYCLNVLVQVARQQKKHGNEGFTAQAIVSKLEPVMERIKRLRSNISKMRSQVLGTAMTLTSDMENDIRALFGVMGEILGNSASHEEFEDNFKCEKCSRTFMTKKGLTSHIRSCAIKTLQ
jgi:hypothetical protein